jgi:drug/metabolite transporter (DMT)-like permease
MWLILSAAGGFSSSIFNFINRYVLKKNADSTSYAWWFEFLRTIIFLIVVILSLRNDFSFDLTHIHLLLLLGIVEFITVFVYMRMHAVTDLSLSAIIIQLRTVWIPVLAFLFLGELLKLNEYAGIFLIFLGQIFVVSPRHFKEDRGIKIAFLASIFTALNTIIMKSALNFYPSEIALVAFGLPTVLGYPIFMKEGKKRINGMGKSIGKKIFLAVIFNAMSMYLLTLALTLEDVSKVSAIYQSLTIVTVLLGIIFLGERKLLARKILGALIVVFGMILLI